MTTCTRHVCHVSVLVSPLGHKIKILTRHLVLAFFPHAQLRRSDRRRWLAFPTSWPAPDSPYKTMVTV